MRYLKWRRTAIVICLGLGVCASGQQAGKSPHSWDVFMNTPEAKGAATKLMGHCGDAQTQDVMNACFAMDFQHAEQQMNSTYKATLKRLDPEQRVCVRTVQKAWLQYRELHCEAVGSIQAGGGSLEPTEVFSCKADLTRARAKEIQNGYQGPE